MKKVTDIIESIILFPFICLYVAFDFLSEFLFEFACNALVVILVLGIPVFLFYMVYLLTFGMAGLPFKFFIFCLILFWLSQTEIWQIAMLVLIPLVTIILAISGKL